MTECELSEPLRRRLAPLRSLGVVTGAGISAESGIATYRGAGGLYDDPEEGDRTIEALTGSTLRRDPDRTWRAVAKIARQSQGAAPNPAHRALAELEQRLRVVVLTQNVDGLHQLAGSRNVIDIHGTVFDVLCMSCDRPGRLESLAELDRAPRCACGGVLRPDVVLFGELLPQTKLQRLYAELAADPPEAVFAIGTTASFPYIAEPVLAARRAGRLTVEVNPEPTELSSIVDFSLRARAGVAVPALCAAIGSS
jgi:NAD-dependent deacetylase